MMHDSSSLKLKSLEIRRTILDMIYRSKSSHIGSAFSIVDILTVLYFNVLRIDLKAPYRKGRDKFILSKGHACTALYSTLAHRGYFPMEKLAEYGTDGTKIAGHVSSGSLPGIETTAGSLGHGLSMGIGMALSAKKDNSDERVFVLVGDGECNEGSIWEAALSAPHFKLDNLVLIVDINKQQGMGSTDEVLAMDPFVDKWQSFNWAVKEVDGHNFEALNDALSRAPYEKNRPTVILARTIKGKGVSLMEDDITWHYKPPNDEEFEQALKELSLSYA